MRFTPRRVAATAAVALTLTMIAAGCGSNDDDSAGGGGSGGKIALLLPESKTTRYETQDKPYFEAKVKDLCSECNVIYSNANQDSSQQLQQAQAALTQGVKAMVLDPVDATAAANIVTLAKQQNVPVVSYDRLISKADIDYYISFDNEQVGKLQAQSLLDKLTADNSVSSGGIVMINGSPTDSNAAAFKKGAHSVFDGKVKILQEFDTPDWSNDKAQEEMQQAITSFGTQIKGVYAANDGTAGGAYAAIKASGQFPVTPPLTGQDAQVDGVQRVLAGQQYMTVYKAVRPEAENAATIAVALAKGETPKIDNVDFTTVNNGTKDVKSVILKPVAVTKDNVKSTVIADNFLKVSDVCTGDYVSACTAAGIS